MAYWKLCDYITQADAYGNRKNPVQDWYGSLDNAAKVEFDFLIQELSGTEDWDAPKPNKRKYRLLKRKHVEMYELIFKVGSRKFRSFGVMYLEKREFVLLGGCEHKRWESIPPGAYDAAYELKKQLDEGKGTTRDHV